jgi:hypothetical protein
LYGEGRAVNWNYRMTSDERFERIEHVTATPVEERRKDREEYRQLWRDTQRQIDDVGRKIDRLAEESRAADQRLEEKINLLAKETRDQIDRLALESREADRRLGERIDALVSAIGIFLTKQNPTPGS